MRARHAFTLIEVVISIFILILLMLLAVPSLTGVLADRRLRRSLDGFNKLVVQAQQLSIEERRPYLLVWRRNEIDLRPESFSKDEEKKATAILSVHEGDAFTLRLTASLLKNPPAEWIFWPSGNCEPAIVAYRGADGSWSAQYSPLTARGEITRYAAK